MNLQEAHPTLKINKRRRGGEDVITGEIYLRDVLIVEIGASYETEVYDPFDEDNPGTASTRRRYYNDPDVTGKLDVNADLSEKDVPAIIDGADFSMTVGELVNAAAIGVVQFLHKAFDLMDSEAKSNECVISSVGGFHPSYKAELERLIESTFKVSVTFRKKGKVEVMEFDID